MTVCQGKLFSEEKWNNISYRSNKRVKENMAALITDAGARYDNNPSLGNRFLFLSDKNRPVPFVERDCSIARKLQPRKRFKDHLDGLLEVIVSVTRIESIAKHQI